MNQPDQTRARIASTALLLCLVARSVGAQAPADRSPQPPGQPPLPPAVEVAQFGFMVGDVEVLRPGGAWTKSSEGQPLAIGDRIRTARSGTARLEFPWTAIAMSDLSEVSIEKNRVLTLQLLSGRLDIDPEQTLMRVVTDEAALSGSGRTLIRREGTTTFVASYNGGAEIEGKGKSVRLGVNKGTVVRAGEAPTDAFVLPPSPRVVSPSADPRYIRPGETVSLTWTGQDAAYHVEILPIDSDVPVMSLGTETLSVVVRLDWLGTFRWRVSGRSGPVESQPSGEGLICVVEK